MIRKLLLLLILFCPALVCVGQDGLSADSETATQTLSSPAQSDSIAIDEHARLLELELQVQKDRMLIYSGIAVIVSLLFVVAILALIIRNRSLEHSRKAQDEIMEGLNESNAQLSERVDTLERDLSDAINTNESILTEPQSLAGSNEGKFRRAFDVLHPNFVSKLTEKYPQLTSGDLLLCMLLYLKHTTEEISIYLNISHASVNSARYRLRQKFALSKEDDLDGFLRSM